MDAFLRVCFIFVLTALAVNAEYRYYYARPSYRNLLTRVNQLEKKVASQQQPVHVHMHGGEEDHSDHSNEEGTHVHVHLSLDGEHKHGKEDANDEYSYATCFVQPNLSTGTVVGTIELRQKPSSNLEVKVDLRGFPGGGQYGIHVHQKTDYGNGCNSFGGHFNPHGKKHGGHENEERHVGDWGNMKVGSNGEIQEEWSDWHSSMFGPNSIMGRGIVIHAGTDDLGQGGNVGSTKTGNAGARLACCVIGWAGEGSWS